MQRSNNIKIFFLLNLFQYGGNLFLDGDCTILQFLTMQVGSISTLDGPQTERGLCTRQLLYNLKQCSRPRSQLNVVKQNA